MMLCGLHLRGIVRQWTVFRATCVGASSLSLRSSYDEVEYRRDVSKETLMLTQMALDLDWKYFGLFEQIIDRHGFEKTVKKLYATKRLISNEIPLNEVLRISLKSKKDPYVLMDMVIKLSRLLSLSIVIGMLKNDHRRRFVRSANAVLLKHYLNRTLGIGGNPSSALLAASEKTDVVPKIKALAQKFPAWCMQRLIESNKVDWASNVSSKARTMISSLEAGMRQMMSEDLAEESAYVCIARAPEILASDNKEIAQRFGLLREEILGEDAADFIIKNPKILSSDNEAEIRERHRLFRAWSDTITRSLPTQSTTIGDASLPLACTPEIFEKALCRMHYVSLYGGARAYRSLSSFVRGGDARFERYHPGFNQWRAVVYKSECSEEFEEELEAHIKKISDQISVLRFLGKYPIFRKALASKPDLTTYASSLTYLSKHLSRDVLSRVDTHVKAQKLLEIDQDQLVAVCKILQIKPGGKS